MEKLKYSNNKLLQLIDVYLTYFKVKVCHAKNKNYVVQDNGTPSCIVC